MEDLISVIITTYNRPARVLKRALDSVLRQTYHNIEVLIINDCPENHKLVEKIEKLVSFYQDNRIQYFINTDNMGACASRNRGIRLSKGKYIAFLDDDDVWLPKKLQMQRELFTDTSIGLVYCSYIEINNKGKETHIKHLVKREQFRKLLEVNYIGSTSLPLIRKSCFEQCGCFSHELKSCQDWEMWIRIAKKYRLVPCEQILAKHIFSTDSITLDAKKRIAGWETLFQLHKKDYLLNYDIYCRQLFFMARTLVTVNDRYCYGGIYFMKAVICMIKYSLKGRKNWGSKGRSE